MRSAPPCGLGSVSLHAPFCASSEGAQRPILGQPLCRRDTKQYRAGVWMAFVFNTKRWLGSCSVGDKNMQKLLGLACLAASLAPLQGSTLQQLSLDDMIRKSTIIVRGQPQPTYSAVQGSVIYTHYQVQVSEVLKGPATNQIDIAVPGGTSNGKTQTFAGVPTLLSGQDYVLFLWTGKSGLTQVIGLSQGLFAVTPNSAGQPIVQRAAAAERMLNSLGQTVSDSDIQMLLSDLRIRIQSVLKGGSGQ